MVSKIMSKNEELDPETQERFLKELRRAMPIIVHNPAKKIYEVEKKINELLKKNVPYKEIQKEIAKLRKYSFQSYIEKNL